LPVAAVAAVLAVAVLVLAVCCLGQSTYRPALFTTRLSALVAQKRHKRQQQQPFKDQMATSPA
jgi:hypothetical protein